MGPPGTPGTDVSIVLGGFHGCGDPLATCTSSPVSRGRINGKDTVHAYAKRHFVFQECLFYTSNYLLARRHLTCYEQV